MSEEFATVWRTIDYVGDGHVLQEKEKLIWEDGTVVDSAPATQYDDYQYSERKRAMRQDEAGETELRLVHLTQLDVDVSKARVGQNLNI